MNRHFKQIKGFDGYYISKTGTIYSKKSHKYLKRNKYVTLYKNDKKFIRTISKLIKETFDNIEIKSGENFKKINNFENYLIDKNGNVYSTHTKKLKKIQINSLGKNYILLSKNGKTYNKLIDNLISETWN